MYYAWFHERSPHPVWTEQFNLQWKSWIHCIHNIGTVRLNIYQKLRLLYPIIRVMHRSTGGARSRTFLTWEGSMVVRSRSSGWLVVHHGSWLTNVGSTTYLALSSGCKILENIQSYTHHGTIGQTQNTSAVWLLPHLWQGIDLWFKDSVAAVSLIEQRTSAVVQLYKYNVQGPWCL